MTTPPVPPDAAVVRLAREGAGISVARAAGLAGISKSRWVQIENGHETRRGQARPARAKPVTIARMAHAVGLPPERLESEGQNPEAATILREIIRQEEASRAGFGAALAAATGATPEVAGEERELAEEILALVAVARVYQREGPLYGADLSDDPEVAAAWDAVTAQEIPGMDDWRQARTVAAGVLRHRRRVEDGKSADGGQAG